jgi:hypothetical protein
VSIHVNDGGRRTVFDLLPHTYRGVASGWGDVQLGSSVTVLDARCDPVAVVPLQRGDWPRDLVYVPPDGPTVLVQGHTWSYGLGLGKPAPQAATGSTRCPLEAPSTSTPLVTRAPER